MGTLTPTIAPGESQGHHLPSLCRLWFTSPPVALEPLCGVEKTSAGGFCTPESCSRKCAEGRPYAVDLGVFGNRDLQAHQRLQTYSHPRGVWLTKKGTGTHTVSSDGISGMA